MKNSLDDLRNHLFATIESLRDEDNPMDLDRATKISEVSQTIINSAKVEVDFLKATGQTTASRFLTSAKPALPEYQGKQLDEKKEQ